MSTPCYWSQVKPEDVKREVTPEVAGAFWKYFKTNYSSKGIGYGDAMDAMSKEFEMPRSVLAQIISTNKTLRPLLDEVYLRNRTSQNALQEARREAQYVNLPSVPRGAQLVWNAYRSLKTLAHGPVFGFTHAIDIAKMPTKMGEFFKNEVNAFKFLNATEHRNAMEAVRDHPGYAFWVRSGLGIEPERAPVGILAQKGGTWASRAWDALKIMRLNLADTEMFTNVNGTRVLKPEFADLSAKEQLEVGKAVASRWNHLTGITSPGEQKLGALAPVMFAPELTAAKWHGFVGDHAKALSIANKAAQRIPLTAAEKKFIGVVARTDGEMTAGRILILAANGGLIGAGLANLPGEKKPQLNFTDPSKGDWLRPKAFGQVFNLRGQDEIVQFLGRLFATGYLHKTAGSGPPASSGEVIGKYVESKLHPSAGAVKQIATGRDYFGRPLPWSGEKGIPSSPKYTTGEYVGTALTPIFMEGAIHEFYQGLRDKGIDPHTANSIMRGLSSPSIVGKALKTGAEEFIGLGVYDERNKEKVPKLPKP